MRVALVHDYLNQYGGAERVLEVLHNLFPDAPVFTSLYDPDAMPERYRQWDIRTSFLQRMPGSRSHHRAYLMLYPLAFESFDLRKYDVVISNSSAWGKGVLTTPQTLHICYCLTPMRFAWAATEYLERERMGGAARRALPPALHYLRMWDVTTANRVDRFIGISRAVVRRIQKYYRRDADLIYPPVNVENIPFSSERGDGFLVVSRLVPYKRIDLAVQACTQLGAPLTVVGDGRDRDQLRQAAGSTVRFTGHVSDDRARHELMTCRAFLFPGEEDFGITPVEAMAAGRPVVAYAGGGALDTVNEPETGRLFAPQTADALATALAQIDGAEFDHHRIREHARIFDTDTFRHQFSTLVEQAWHEHRSQESVAHGSLASV